MFREVSAFSKESNMSVPFFADRPFLYLIKESRIGQEFWVSRDIDFFKKE
jgi:hypothetical protein